MGQRHSSRQHPSESTVDSPATPDLPIDPATNGRAQPGDASPPTSRLLSAARRARDYKQEGRGTSRQLDIALRFTPLAGVFFRCWANPAEEYPVAILKVKSDQDRNEVYILTPEVADLPHIAPRVRDATLIPCITTTGLVSVWAKTVPDPADRMGYRTHAALARVAEDARKRWVMISWDRGALAIEEPRTPIEDDPSWPKGQTLEEIFEIAIRAQFIDDPEHPVIRRLDTIAREV